MKYLVHDLTGSIHLISSILALVIGSCVLVTSKGTRMHKRMGYAYALSMLALNATAFDLYHYSIALARFTSRLSLVLSRC
jgi:uncharacterized membrane protein